jgi:hypothetical protein
MNQFKAILKQFKAYKNSKQYQHIKTIFRAIKTLKNSLKN